MGWNQDIFTVLIVVEGGTGQGLFIYNGAPGLGNPPVLSITNSTSDPFGNTVTPSLTLSGLPILMYSGPPALGNLLLSMNPGADTTDQFGNPYQTGYQFHGSDGANIEMTVIAGIPRLFFSTGVPEESTSGVIEAQVTNPGASEFLTLFLAGPRISVGSAGTGSASFTAAGAFNWTAPFDLSGGVVKVIPTGGGGGSGASSTADAQFAGGGGGGGDAIQNIAVTPGVTYSGFVGAGGTAGVVPNGNGGNGQASTFTGDSATSTGPGGGAGLGSSTVASGGPAGAAGTGGFAGGAGGAGGPLFSGGGGSSAGNASAGNNGASGAAGGAGGAAVAGGGPGASAPGPSHGNAPGLSPSSPPGGGASGGQGNTVNEPGAAGATGQVLLSWTTAPVTGSYVTVNLDGENADRSGQAVGQLSYVGEAGTPFTELLSWSNLGVQVVDMIPGDNQIYQTEDYRQTLTADIPITSATSFAQVFGDFSPGVGTYEIDIFLKVLPTVNGGKIVTTFSSFGAVVSNMGVEVIEFIEGTPGSLGNIGPINAFSSDFTGTAMTSGIGRHYKITGTMIVSTAGVFNLEVATSVTGDNFTIQHGGTYASFKPVGST